MRGSCVPRAGTGSQPLHASPCKGNLSPVGIFLLPTNPGCNVLFSRRTWLAAPQKAAALTVGLVKALERVWRQCGIRLGEGLQDSTHTTTYSHYLGSLARAGKHQEIMGTWWKLPEC